MSEEQSCRICRGEATQDDPLFYPCKCRGSIKYIHQGCLEEWLKHSGREPSCDICHVEYKFTTQFKDDTPERVPLKLIFTKLKNSFAHLFRYGLTIAFLILGVVIQIPLFWKAISRIFTWIIDGDMPYSDVLVSLIYGESPVEGNPYEFAKMAKALISTYWDSLIFILIWFPIHLILFLEHEWVSRDPGFKILILKKIGPAENIVNVARPNRFVNNRNNNINNNNNDNDNEDDPEFNDRMARDVQNLQRLLEHRNHPQNAVIQDALRVIEERQRMLRVEHQNRLRRRNNEDDLLEEEDEEHDPDFYPSDSSDNESEYDNQHQHANFDARPDELLHARNEMRRRVEDQIHERPVDQRPHIPFPFIAPRDINQDQQDQQQQQPRPFGLGRDDDWFAPIDNNNNNIPQPNPVPQPQVNGMNGNVDDGAAAAAAAAALNAIPEEEDDVLLSLPIYMIVVGGDAFLGAYLFLTYFIPSGLGYLSVLSLGLAWKGFINGLNKAIIISGLRSKFDTLLEKLILLKNYNSTVSSSLDYYIILPVVNTLSNVYNHTLPQSTIERIVPLAVFYGAVYCGILYYLKSKTRVHSRSNPLLGYQRKLFILLLDLVCTFKVFVIFAIELVFFPIYCGFLLELSLTPILSYNTTLILSENFVFNEHLSLRLFIYWATGTIYMCLFALFVGMTRKYILRPGVLFFIRSPEDPNARLIHDALVRPFGLQVSRIGLSGFVYSLFILIGFGGVTYAFKLTQSPVLPLEFQPMLGILFANVTIYNIRSNMDLIKKYVRQYWVRAFKISSTKLRLSSFILGKHDPRERGYVYYRNLKAQLENAKPDYTEPKSVSQAKELFKTTDVRAVFIPDGNLIRAPKNDTVSRKFVRRLFIAVSKDDKPLTNSYDAGIDKIDEKYPLDEFDDSEDELTTTNQYEIVYRPPHFGVRIVLFLTMLWIFAAILIVGVGFTLNIIGKPFSYATYMFDIAVKHDVHSIGEIWALLMKSEFNLLRLNTSSLLISSQIAISLLSLYDNSLQRRHIQIDENEVDANEAVNVDQATAPVVVVANEVANDIIDVDPAEPIPIVRPTQRQDSYSHVLRDLLKFITVTAKITATTAFFFINIFSWLCLCVMAHVNAIEAPFKLYYGEGAVDSENMTLTLNRFTLPLHLILFTFTFLPFLQRFRPDITKILRDGPDDVLNFTHVFKSYTVAIFSRLVSVELILALFKVGLALNEYFEHSLQYTSLKATFYYIFVQQGLYKETVVYSWSVVVALNVLYGLFVKGARLFGKINQQIKEEYYTTGKTLENSIDTEGGEAALLNIHE